MSCNLKEFHPAEIMMPHMIMIPQFHKAKAKAWKNKNEF